MGCCSPTPCVRDMVPSCSVVLRRLQLALPMKLHELLMGLDYSKQDVGMAM